MKSFDNLNNWREEFLIQAHFFHPFVFLKINLIILLEIGSMLSLFSKTLPQVIYQMEYIVYDMMFLSSFFFLAGKSFGSRKFPFCCSGKQDRCRWWKQQSGMAFFKFFYHLLTTRAMHSFFLYPIDIYIGYVLYYFIYTNVISFLSTIIFSYLLLCGSSLCYMIILIFFDDFTHASKTNNHINSLVLIIYIGYKYI